MDVRTPSENAQRFADVDAALRSVNLGISVGAGASGLAFAPVYGWAFAASLLLMPAYWGIRLVLVDRIGSRRQWAMLLIATWWVVLCGACSQSGGADSAGVFFAGLLAVLVHVYFPGSRVALLAVIGPIAVIASYDVVRGAPIDLGVLVPALLLGLYLPSMIERLVEMEQTQRRRATIDLLTGCLNRRALEDRAAELEQQSRRLDGGMAAVMFDLDHFKAINDAHGHAFGDRVLAHVAYVVRASLRRFELFYRLGGEEFCVLLPGADVLAATDIAETLRAAIEAAPVDGERITASFGVAATDAPVDVLGLVERADAELYEAKRAGRNRVVFEPA